MTENFSPHLCGGTLYDLLLEARKPRTKARNKLSGGSDGLSAPDLYAGLVNIVTGEDISAYTGTSLEKCASDYKKCVSSKGSYVPFTQQSTASAFSSAVKRQNSDILKRMSEFIYRFLSFDKSEWLVRALIETLKKDSEIHKEELFAIDYKTNVAAENLPNVEAVILQPFLISVLDYVLQHCPDCESGRDTFLAWYKQTTPKAEWKFCSDIGNAIHPIKVVITSMEDVLAITDGTSTSKTDGIYSLHQIPPAKPFIPISPVRYDSDTRIIYLETEEFLLPVQLLPQSIITTAESPYINALCEVYAEKLQQAVSPERINDLPTKFQRDYTNQRKAFYSAESMYHAVRDVFADGDKQFDILKDDAYEGIETTYYDERYRSGYERLHAVLEKITSTTLSKSALHSIVGLLGNLEKKGICHILVNDERIKSWVNIDE